MGFCAIKFLISSGVIPGPPWREGRSPLATGILPKDGCAVHEGAKHPRLPILKIPNFGIRYVWNSIFYRIALNDEIVNIFLRRNMRRMLLIVTPHGVICSLDG